MPKEAWGLKLPCRFPSLRVVNPLPTFSVVFGPSWTVCRSFVISLLAVLALGLGAGCERKAAESDGTGTTTPTAQGPIKIGEFASLTGKEATFGNS